MPKHTPHNRQHKVSDDVKNLTLDALEHEVEEIQKELTFAYGDRHKYLHQRLAEIRGILASLDDKKKVLD